MTGSGIVRYFAVTFLITSAAHVAYCEPLTSRSLDPNQIYLPDRIHLTARVYHDAKYRNWQNPPSRSAPQQVEAWYFKNVCVVSQAYPPLPNHPPEKWVYAYRHGSKSRKGELSFQQWGSPRAKALTRYNSTGLPADAWPVNPLWYLMDFQEKKFAAGDKVKVLPGAAGTRTVQVPGEPFISEPRNETYDNNFLISNDRVLSITLERQITYHRQKAAPNYVPPPPHSDVLYEVVASDFDEHFPAVPRRIEKRRSEHGRDAVTEVDSISAIPPDVTPEDVIREATEGLQPIRLDKDGFEVTFHPREYVVHTLSGESVNLADVTRDKTALIYLWASWAPENLFNSTYGENVGIKYNVLERLKAVYKKYGNDPDVIILGLSVDPDPAAAKAFADANQMPWQNYIVPADRRRAAIRTFGNGAELPSAMVLNRRGKHGLREKCELKGVFGFTSDSELEAGEEPWIPFIGVVEEDRGAKQAGGYAKHWLGEEVIAVLQNFEAVEVCALTGDHMSELSLGTYTPPPRMPPLVSGQPLPPPPPMPRADNMPTSVSVLGNYPVKQKAPVKDTGLALEVARMLLDDNAVTSRYGEESFPGYRRAITFRKGKDIVGITGIGNDFQVYFNDDQKAWLLLSDEATAKLEELYKQMAKAAGVRVDRE